MKIWDSVYTSAPYAYAQLLRSYFEAQKFSLGCKIAFEIDPLLLVNNKVRIELSAYGGRAV